MYLNYGFHIFSKNLIANIILIIQLTVSIILMNITLGLYNEAYSKLDVLSGFNSDSVVYQNSSDKLLSEQNIEEYKKELNITDNIKLEPIMNGFSSSDNGAVMFCAYGSNTSRSMRLTIKSGQWYEDCKKDTEYINTVVYGSSKYNVGETYTMKLCNFATEEQKAFKFKITGIIDEKTGVILGNTGSNSISVKEMFETFNSENYGADYLFLFNYEDNSDIKNYLTFSSSLFAYSNDNSAISTQDINNMKKLGQTFTIREISDNTKDGLQSEMHSVFPSAISITLIGVIGIICLIILNTIKCKKVFAVYFICGMKWKDCLKIIICHILCIFIGTVFLVAVAFGVMASTNMFTETHLLIKWNNLFITLGLFVMVLAVSIITAKCMLSNTSPVTDLRKE